VKERRCCVREGDREEYGHANEDPNDEWREIVDAGIL
jgi:hypothetical protein